MFYLYKKGQGILYCHLPQQLVGTFDTWAECFNRLRALQDGERNFYYFMTNKELI